MGDVEVSRGQRLRALEAQIREDYEAFVRTGFALKEIRDDELYREAGFTTWVQYLKARVNAETAAQAEHAGGGASLWKK